MARVRYSKLASNDLFEYSEFIARQACRGMKCNFSVLIEDFAGCSIAESLTWSIVNLFQSVLNVSCRHTSEV